MAPDTVMLSVVNKTIMLRVIMLSVVLLNVIMLSVIILGVIMLSLVAPSRIGIHKMINKAQLEVRYLMRDSVKVFCAKISTLSWAVLHDSDDFFC
jgi:hypothetical protein